MVRILQTQRAHGYSAVSGEWDVVETTKDVELYEGDPLVQLLGLNIKQIAITYDDGRVVDYTLPVSQVAVDQQQFEGLQK